MALADIRDATLPTSSLAPADIRDATLPTWLLALAHIGDATLPTSSLALAHIRDATRPTSSLALADIRDGSKVSVHTGGIDQAWKDLKKNVPNSIATRKDGAPNPLLCMAVRHTMAMALGKQCLCQSEPFDSRDSSSEHAVKELRQKKSEKSNFFVVFLWRNANPSKNKAS